MTGAAGSALYTPRMLSLALSLAEHPLDLALPLRGEARSRSCGSTVSFAGSVDPQGRIERFGLQVKACAVGQAAAALFAADAEGRTCEQIEAALAELKGWLAGGPPPSWPGIEAIAPAQPYPGRHDAILLAWRAAAEALCKAHADG